MVTKKTRYHFWNSAYYASIMFSLLYMAVLLCANYLGPYYFNLVAPVVIPLLTVSAAAIGIFKILISHENKKAESADQKLLRKLQAEYEAEIKRSEYLDDGLRKLQQEVINTHQVADALKLKKGMIPAVAKESAIGNKRLEQPLNSTSAILLATGVEGRATQADKTVTDPAQNADEAVAEISTALEALEVKVNEINAVDKMNQKTAHQVRA